MFFDYNKKSYQLYIQHQQEEEEMLKHGMNVDDIGELFRFDKRQLYSDYKYYKSKDLSEPIDNETVYNIPFTYELLDEIEDQRLYQALIKLNPIEREVIILHVVNGLTIKQIANLWSRPYDTIMHRYYSSLNKLKKLY